MKSVLRIKRIKFNKNLGTVDEFSPDVCIDMEVDAPIRWETYQWKPKRKEYLFTKIFLSSGDTLIVDMTIPQWEEYYSKFLEVYQIAIDNKNPEPIKES